MTIYLFNTAKGAPQLCRALGPINVSRACIR